MEILFIYKFYMCTKSDRFTFLRFIGTGGVVCIPDCQHIAIVSFCAIKYHSQFTSNFIWRSHNCFMYYIIILNIWIINNWDDWYWVYFVYIMIIICFLVSHVHLDRLRENNWKARYTRSDYWKAPQIAKNVYPAVPKVRDGRYWNAPRLSVCPSVRLSRLVLKNSPSLTG